MVKQVILIFSVLMFMLPLTTALPAYAGCTGTVSKCIGNIGKSSSTDQAPSKKTTRDVSQAQTEINSGGGTFVAFIKLVFALLIVLLLIYILYRFVHRRTQSFQEDGLIKNMGGVAVGTNRSVQLIRVGQEILVVGVGENVHLLKEIVDPREIEQIIKQKQEPPETLGHVWERLKSLWMTLQGTSKIPTESMTNKKKKSFHHYLNNQLQAMQDERKKHFDRGRKKEDQS